MSQKPKALHIALSLISIVALYFVYTAFLEAREVSKCISHAIDAKIAARVATGGKATMKISEITAITTECEAAAVAAKN